MTLPQPNADRIFDGVDDEVSTGRRTIALNPEASAFEPPTERNKEKPVNPFMNEDGLESSCGDSTPTGEDSSPNFVKAGSDDVPTSTTNNTPTNPMTEGQMAEAAASQEVRRPVQSPVSETDNTTKPDSGGEWQELPKEKIIELVLEQVPFFFSRENWSSDPYLLSQMDSDQYVPLHVLASCSQFKMITKNHYSIMDALKQSELVQLDVEKNRVRPNYKRCIVILREIPELTPHSEIEELFSHEDCPKVVNCEFINNDSWYVTFDNDDDAQKAYRHLREVVKTFKDKPIAARIKTKPLTRQNCFAVLPTQPKQQQQQQQQQQPSNGNGPPPSVSGAINPANAAYVNSQRVYYPTASSSFNYYPNVSSQVQPTVPAFFYPNPLMQWPPTNSNFYDMNSFLNFNGLSPKATFKPSSMATRFPTNAVNPNNASKGTKKWDKFDRNEARSESANSNSASVSRVSSAGPRSSTVSTNSFTVTNPTQVVALGRAEGGFSAPTTFVPNDVSPLTNQGMYSFSPPVTTDMDSERTNDVSSLVSTDYATAYMPAPYEGQAAPAQMMPVGYGTAVPAYAPVLYRNGFNEQRPMQRNNAAGGRRRPRRDDDQNSNGQGGKGSYQRAYNADVNSRIFQDRRKPQFNLQATSFPPLPGSDELPAENVVVEEPIESTSSTAWNVDTQKFSDIMKGTAKTKNEKIEVNVASTAGAANPDVASNQNQSSNVETVTTSQAIAKPKQVNETRLESREEEPTAEKSVSQPRTQAPKEQRVPKQDEKRLGKRELFNTSISRAKKDSVKFGGGNKENRPTQSVRPAVKKEVSTEEGWNKVKSSRSNVTVETSLTGNDGSQKLHVKHTRPLTNGDISPPPSRVNTDENKSKKDASSVVGNAEKKCDSQANTNVSRGNNMSWAKMAKSGKDAMEKLSAVIKEKEQEERSKKSRTGGRPQLKPQEKIVPVKEGKSFRKDKPEAKPITEKNPAAIKPKEVRSRSPHSP